MKSLEIVKKNKLKIDGLNECVLVGKDLEQIIQDLEVLEILRKKKVNIDYLQQYFNDKRFTLEDIHYLTTLNNMYLTLDELKKIKQWLEENENDR